MYEYIFPCFEPDGLKLRLVKPLEYADIPRVYASLRASLAARGRELPPELAAREFARLDKLYWTVDDVGLIIANKAGDVHIFFWDKRLRGRERLSKEMAKVIMDIFGRLDLFTEIPVSERAVIAFAKRVGFEQDSATDETVVLRLKRS